MAAKLMPVALAPLAQRLLPARRRTTCRANRVCDLPFFFIFPCEGEGEGAGAAEAGASAADAPGAGEGALPKSSRGSSSTLSSVCTVTGVSSSTVEVSSRRTELPSTKCTVPRLPMMRSAMAAVHA